MTEPTDAERVTAIDLAVLAYTDASMGGISCKCFAERIATALATARAEGWRAGVEAAATIVDTLPIGLALIAKVVAATRDEYARYRVETKDATVQDMEAGRGLVEALRAVIAVADRKTVEFDKARAALAATPTRWRTGDEPA